MAVPSVVALEAAAEQARRDEARRARRLAGKVETRQLSAEELEARREQLAVRRTERSRTTSPFRS